MIPTLAAGYFCMVTAAGMFAPALAALAAGFGISTGMAGQLGALAPLMWGVLAPVIGLWSGRLGRRPLVSGGLALMGLGSLAAAVSPNVAALAASRLLTGAGGAAFGPMGWAVIADALPAARRAPALGKVTAGYSAGALLGLPAVAYVTGVAGWRWAFAAVGLSLFAMAAATWAGCPGGKTDPSPPLSRWRWRHVSHVRPALLLLGHTLHQAGGAATATYTAAFLVERFGVPLRDAALPLAMIAAGAVAGSLAGGWAARRPLRLSMAACAATALLAPLFLAGFLPLTLAIGVATAGALAQSVRYPAHLSLMTAGETGDRGTLLGLNAMANQLGHMLGAVAGGAALGLAGYHAVGLIAGLSSAAACAVFALVAIAGRPHRTVKRGTSSAYSS